MRLLPIIFAGLCLAPLWAQDVTEDETPPERPMKPPVMLIFTPPDLEGSIVFGIFDAAGKLVRELEFEPGDSRLVIDTNGYIVKWDGLDQTGKPCPAGRYSAHGYMVGDEVSVEGEAFHFNDWMAEDKIPAQGVDLRSWPDAFGVTLQTAKGPVYGKVSIEGTFSPERDPMGWAQPKNMPPKLDPAPIGWAEGRDGTTWVIVEKDGQRVVAQLGKDVSEPLRELRVPASEPQPVAILASTKEDEILLKEAGPGGVERVRLLKRGGAAAEKDGRVTADWEVVFERSLQPCAKFGVADGKLVADAGGAEPPNSMVVSLVENALEPGKKAKLKLVAKAAKPGSALFSPEGLKLIEISETGDWSRFALEGQGPGTRLFQGDGFVVEEFTLKNLDQLAAFDAGTFLLAPAVP